MLAGHFSEYTSPRQYVFTVSGLSAALCFMGDKLLENFLPLFDIFCAIDTFLGGFDC